MNEPMCTTNGQMLGWLIKLGPRKFRRAIDFFMNTDQDFRVGCPRIKNIDQTKFNDAVAAGRELRRTF